MSPGWSRLADRPSVGDVAAADARRAEKEQTYRSGLILAAVRLDGYPDCQVPDYQRAKLQRANSLCLRALGALGYIELNALVLVEAAKSVRVDR